MDGATKLPVTISDEGYESVQRMIQAVAQTLIDPKSGLGKPSLDLFIERAEQSQGLGPILHPSEWRDGTDQLGQVLAHARALRTARNAILEAVPDAH